MASFGELLVDRHYLFSESATYDSERWIAFPRSGQGIVLPVKDGLGHRLVEAPQVALRIDGLYLDIEWLQFYLKRLGDTFQSMLARAIWS